MPPRQLLDLLVERYDAPQIGRVEAALREHGTLTFVPVGSGLFSASTLESMEPSSRYRYVWSRDNTYVGWAHFVGGDVPGAVAVARALLAFYGKHQHRFDAIIGGKADPDDAMLRPHVRFDGATLSEIASERWPHAQNDALGYVLWYCATLLHRRAFDSRPEERQTLALFPRYFEAIRYWQDQDSGHWEEVRKIAASSIGVVVAALEAWQRLMLDEELDWPSPEPREDAAALAMRLAARGRQVLDGILPNECIQPGRLQHREHDAALLFLLYPLQLLSEDLEARILANCERHLRGNIGFRRYLGDSYWAPDYDVKLPSEEQTRDYSGDLDARNALLGRIGDEAQWCLFDSIVSAHFGARYRRTADERDLARQAEYLNRALRQVTTGDDRTPGWRCPELYYLRRGAYSPNPHVPLLWAQANLWVAVQAMNESVAVSTGHQ